MGNFRTYDIRYWDFHAKKYRPDADRGTLEYAARALEAHPPGTVADCEDNGEIWEVERCGAPYNPGRVPEGVMVLAGGQARARLIKSSSTG